MTTIGAHRERRARFSFMGWARDVFERRANALWHFVRFAIAATYFWIGGTYLFGGADIFVPDSLRPLLDLVPGGVRTHGAILFVLAFFIASRAAVRGATVWALTGTLFYSLFTTSMILGSWAFQKPDLAAPAWYLLVAACSFALLVNVPTALRRSKTWWRRA